MTSPQYEIGTWVRSIPVGIRAGFVGEIVDILNDSYVIRDAEKRRWLRTTGELEPAQ